MSRAEAGEKSSEYTERRLSRAVEHVSKHWLPYNPEVLKAVRAGVREGRYELGSEFLLADLKRDLGLFSFCLRELLQSQRKLDASILLTSPEVPFEGISSTEILSLLDRAEKALASHSLENTKDSQAAQLRYTLVSAATAEVLASRTELDSEAAFLSSLFRQLGLLLVAWNYPTVFDKAQRAVGGGEALDRELMLQLGFSPEVLGHSILESFCPDPDLEAAVNATGEYLPESGLSKTAWQLAEICRVGEVLAQANDPERYPKAQASWEEAKEVLNRSLGSDGMKVIRDAVTRYGGAYQSANPSAFSELNEIDPERRLQEAKRRGSQKTNPFVERCPLHIRQRLNEFYETLGESFDSKSAVSRILSQIIPVTGFEAGIIATIEPSRMELIPRLKFGRIALQKVETLSFGGRLSTDNPLLAALAMPAPYMSRAEGAERAFVVGGLGGENPLGVLYVECGTELLDRQDFELLTVFKAVLRAIEDALKLNSRKDA